MDLTRSGIVKTLIKGNVQSRMLQIGPYGTRVSHATLQTINWEQTQSAVTRKLLMEVFGRETLATSSLSGKESPAFKGCNKPRKAPLDRKKVEDVKYFLVKTLRMDEKEVVNAIVNKCADECKAKRRRDASCKRMLDRLMEVHKLKEDDSDSDDD